MTEVLFFIYIYLGETYPISPSETMVRKYEPKYLVRIPLGALEWDFETVPLGYN